MSLIQVNHNQMIKATATAGATLDSQVSRLFDDIQSYMAIRSITMPDLDMQYSSV